jgi:hypothetical protein
MRADFQMSLPLPITNGPQFICHTSHSLSFTSHRILYGAVSAALAAIPLRCESQFNSFIYAYFGYKPSGFTHHTCTDSSKVLVQCIAVRIPFLCTIFKERSANSSEGLADSRGTQQTRRNWTGKIEDIIL